MRGGLVYAERLRRERPHVRGIISATRGNHGQSLAWAGRRYGIAVTVVVPHGNSMEKNAAMRAFGARLIEHGDDFEMAREEAARLAASEELEFAPSFAPDLVKGVATYSLELFRAVPKLDALYVPIGLGSGICGAILMRDLLGLVDRDHRCAGGRCGALCAFVRRGPRDRGEPRRDACRRHGGAPAGCRSVRHHPCRRSAHRYRVGRRDRRAAIRAYWTDTHNLVEGAGAAPLAALLDERERMAGKRVGLVVSGGNIDLALFRSWVLREPQAAVS